jgi:raffinose/stachyose/melibiose transport system permease protein
MGLQLFMALSVAVMLYPLFVMVSGSFKSMKSLFTNPYSLPIPPEFTNYVTAFQGGDLLVYLKNSTFITAVSILGLVFTGTLAAYPISRLRFPGQRFLYLFFLAGLVFPDFMAIIPLFAINRTLGLIDTPWSLIFKYWGWGLPFTIFFMSNFYQTIPRELEEAAMVDGATPFRAYRYIMLPLTRAAVATVAIVYLVVIWNDFMYPMVFLHTAEQQTIMVGVLTFFHRWAQLWTPVFAYLVMASLPLVLAYLVASRQFIEGMTRGAIKG